MVEVALPQKTELTELDEARLILVDLIIGRMFRGLAAGTLDVALECERLGAPANVLAETLERAERQEWIAARSEQGQILWGGRVSRHGDVPEGQERR